MASDATPRRGGALLLALVLVLATLTVHGGLLSPSAAPAGFFGAEEPDALYPYSIEALAAVDAGHVLSVPRADADQPLGRLLYRLTWDAWGADAAAHRRVGVGLHALTALLLYLGLRRRTTAGAAAFTAFAFALASPTLHASQWISMQPRVLAGALAALALAVDGCCRSGRRAADACYLLALLAHPSALPLPLVFLMTDRASGVPVRAALGRTLTLFALAGAWLVHVWSGTTGAFAWIAGTTFLVLVSAACVGARGRPITDPAQRLLYTGLIWALAAHGVADLALPYGMPATSGATQAAEAYLAWPGLFLALVGAWRALGGSLPRLARMGPALAVLCVAGLATGSLSEVPHWRNATVRAETWLASQPADARAQRLHGQALLRRGRLTEARRAFDLANAHAGPEADPDAMAGLGILDLRRPLLGESQRKFERALELDPDHVVAHHRLGEVLQRRGDPAGAAEHLAAAVERAPTFVRPRTRLAVVLATLGNTDEARRHAERALVVDPEAREAWLALGMAAELEGDPARARESYRAALAIERDYAEAMTNLGRLQLAAGEVELALATLERAHFLHPLYADALYNLALAYRAAGRDAEAIDFLERTLGQTRHQRATVELGFLLLAAGRLEEAQARAEEALAVNPNHPGGRELLAEVALAAGEWRAAAQHLEEVLRSGVERPDLAARLVRLYAAAPDAEVRNAELALVHARRWAQGSDDPRLLAALAAAQAEAGQLEAARATIARALAGVPATDVALADQLLREQATYARGEPLRIDPGAGR